ncbi:type II secretion system minor pseudopilin GspI [Parahaliea aestuarii]|uniref:Type II secretion system protein I n=1 Tax=Parahaliea aestuarii TaxID=1852021 RepID=A0A5C9A5H3_9GAMM|nr:type II secretion system minor pseudopilin GspI [Parahaliea aestuarii]TXS94990.1 type II secretion system protein GspI [Parahaliea aestuarii]
MTTETRSSGFTLVEVMVALAVVALALPALIMALYQQVDGTEHLRDKSMAQIVAANKLAELRLLSQARGNLLQGEESGGSELAGRDWSWQIRSSSTPVQSFQRIEIEVRRGENNTSGPALYTLNAFMSAEIESADQEPVADEP